MIMVKQLNIFEKECSLDERYAPLVTIVDRIQKINIRIFGLALLKLKKKLKVLMPPLLMPTSNSVSLGECADLTV